MNDRVVSSDDEMLILVDSNDQALGELSKRACHDGQGVLHRAFSVFLFDDSNRLLVQQRAPSKRLWPMYWANSCCSHPRVGEGMVLATQRRMEEELGATAPLKYAYRFEYHARFGELGSEYELCSVFLGRIVPDELNPNPTEIVATRWLTLDEVDGWTAEPDDSAQVAPWFRMEWQRFRGEHAETLTDFLNAPSALVNASESL